MERLRKTLPIGTKAFLNPEFRSDDAVNTSGFFNGLISNGKIHDPSALPKGLPERVFGLIPLACKTDEAAFLRNVIANGGEIIGAVPIDRIDSTDPVEDLLWQGR